MKFVYWFSWIFLIFLRKTIQMPSLTLSLEER